MALVVATRLLAALFVALVSAGGETAAAEGPQRSTGPCAPGSVVSMRTMRVAYSATAQVPLHARRELTAHSGIRFELRNANGAATVFGVLAARVDRSCRPTDYEVQLPIRPNGSTGWVRAADVHVRSVRTRIRVDLSKRRITLFRDGRAILVTTAAVGAPSTPTPTGHFYVNQRLLTAEPVRRLRPWRNRHLGVLRGAPELAPGRADRHPRDGRARLDRLRDLARMPANSQRRRPTPAQAGSRGNAGRDQALSGRSCPIRVAKARAAAGAFAAA